jgi:hypothetical protein
MSPPPSTKANGNGATIDKRDFDASKPLLRDSSSDERGSSASGRRYLDNDDDFLSDLVDGIIERDRRNMKREIVKAFSFFCAVLSWYAILPLRTGHVRLSGTDGLIR